MISSSSLLLLTYCSCHSNKSIEMTSHCYQFDAIIKCSFSYEAPSVDEEASQLYEFIVTVGTHFNSLQRWFIKQSLQLTRRLDCCKYVMEIDPRHETRDTISRYKNTMQYYYYYYIYVFSSCITVHVFHIIFPRLFSFVSLIRHINSCRMLPRFGTCLLLALTGPSWSLYVVENTWSGLSELNNKQTSS